MIGRMWLRKAVAVAALVTASLAAPTIARAADAANAADAAARTDLDSTWVIVATALVLLMQIGFMLLEGGAVRSKNSVNVAQKNLSDLMISISTFATVGFMVMFGPTAFGVVGASWSFFALSQLDEQTLIFFAFQAAFCGAAATIVSGAVAERMSYPAYLWLIPIIAAVIYPFFGHWSWGAALEGENSGAWLGNLGFVDFAGSTVVHSIGAWVALAAVLSLGPRWGRYDGDGVLVKMHGHSALLATVGALMLYIGWIGFNAGSALTASISIGPIVVNTVLAGAFGGVASLIAGRAFDQIYRPERSINGVLAGLVAVTAGCAAVDIPGAIALGVTGALIAAFADRAFERNGIDDPVGAIAVHGVSGAWGTIALVFFAPVEALPTGSRIDQFGIQALGVGVAFAWTFGVAWLWLRIVARFRPLRVSPEDEVMGLNKSEHGEALGAGEMQTLLGRIVAGEVSPSARIEVDPGHEAAEHAELMNRLLAMLERHEAQRRIAEEQTRFHDDDASERVAS